MADLQALANKLDKLQARENEGKGLSYVRMIVKFLRLGSVEMAKVVCNNESDKFHGLDEIQDLLVLELFEGKDHPWFYSWGKRRAK